MKKLVLAMALVVAGLSLGGCFVGKGKAPAPVVSQGTIFRRRPPMQDFVVEARIRQHKTPGCGCRSREFG